MAKFYNITSEDIKSANGTLRLVIDQVTVEELPKLDGSNDLHSKIVLKFTTTDGTIYPKYFIANNTSLGRLAHAETDPKKWPGLIVNIKCKTIAITDKFNANSVRYEDQKYIDSVEGAEKYDLVGNLIKMLNS